MIRPRPVSLAASLVALLLTLSLGSVAPDAAGTLPAPEQFIGFPLGADGKLVRWDRIVEYMALAAKESDRVRLRELGKTSRGQSFIALEISAPDTLRNLDRYKQLAGRLYFQDGPPTPRERDEIFRHGKVVVLVTCSVHGNEIGATQMTLGLVHRLATSDAPEVKKVLDNVIFLLVPSANPDGQILVTDWFNSTVGTPYEGSPLPRLYHPYVGHDSNRDMYMLTQKESQYLARLAWHEWFPNVWLDEHQMGESGARMFVMPAADPINPNVHPLIYRWNAILGQSQAAALEAAGKEGIIYNSTYTNFWQGALAWSGWWHNQIGLLTEVASVRVASPVEQLRIASDGSVATCCGRGSAARQIPPPVDVTPRTEYPRPWLGGRWTLRDIVDYEHIATMALLEAAADRRETILRQIYEINRQTVEAGEGDVKSILIPVNGQQDPREAAHLADRLIAGGVDVFRARAPFDADGRRYAEGSFVIPMAQVFSRYAKDLLEKQTYPEVRRGPNAPVEPPYDVTAWSLGMLLGVDVQFSKTVPAVASTRVIDRAHEPGSLTGNGAQFTFAYRGPDGAVAINRLLKSGATVDLEGSVVTATAIRRDRMETIARELGLQVTASPPAQDQADRPSKITLRAPRIAVYSPWTGGNTDEGWTRWVLEQYEFQATTVHNEDIRRGGLNERFDVLVLPHQDPRDILEGQTSTTIKPEYRGGIGETGVENLVRFVGSGGTLVALGAASDLAIDRMSVPVRNLKRGLRRDQHSAPGTIVRLQVETGHPIGYGMAPETFGFYTNGPLFAPIDSLATSSATSVARYAAADVLASGWLRGEELMAGRSAVVSVDMNPGRIVLFGIRPQHRAQTHATFPMLFNSLYAAAASDGRFKKTNQ
jgi:hypothetical protein